MPSFKVDKSKRQPLKYLKTVPDLINLAPLSPESPSSEFLFPIAGMLQDITLVALGTVEDAPVTVRLSRMDEEGTYSAEFSVSAESKRFPTGVSVQAGDIVSATVMSADGYTKVLIAGLFVAGLFPVVEAPGD